MATFVGFSRICGNATNVCFNRFGTHLLTKSCIPALRLPDIQIANFKPILPQSQLPSYKVKLPWVPRTPSHQVEIPDTTKEDEELSNAIIKRINEQIASRNTGRLFAVIQVCGKQFKVTESDIIIVEGYWPPNPGDELKLEKVLLVGSTDFTLIGKPLLNRELVSVDATVIEKTLSHTKTHFRFRKRKQYRRINFYRAQHTMVRINGIDILGDIDKKKEVEGLDRIY